MNNFISNIELNNNYIIITYQDDTKKKITYNQINRLKVLKEIKEEENYLIKEKNYLKRLKIINSLFFTLNIFFNIFINFLINNTLIHIITIIFSLEFLILSQLINKYIKKNYYNLDQILHYLLINQLPKEDEFLFKQKCIDLSEYKRLKDINQSYSDNYLNELYQFKTNNLPSDNNSKILEFKLKDEK